MHLGSLEDSKGAGGEGGVCQDWSRATSKDSGLAALALRSIDISGHLSIKGFSTQEILGEG